MIIETAQMLSTAHRYLDGKKNIETINGRKKTTYVLADPQKEEIVYKAAHVNHPSTIWIRQNKKHYEWAYQLFVSLCAEYTYRYGKTHATEIKLKEFLKTPPLNINDTAFEQPPQAMPEQYKDKDSIKAYHNYYNGEKTHFSVWTKREIPSWFKTTNK